MHKHTTRLLLGIIAALLATLTITGIVIATQIHEANERERYHSCLIALGWNPDLSIEQAAELSTICAKENR